MIKHFKIFMLMLGLISMTSVSLSAQPVKSIQPNILTLVQQDDEIIELEGEEGDFDDYVAEADNAATAKKSGTSFKDIISYVLLGIILIAFLYGFYWLRHNSVSQENHPIIYVALKVSKFSAIIGFIACITFLICQFGLKLSNLQMGLVIGGFGLVIALYAVFKSIKSYEFLDGVGTKITVTVVSVALGLAIGYALLYLGMAVLCLYILWYAVKDKLGWDKVVLADGTEIRRINSFSNQYRDADGNTYERTSDGYVKI